MDYFSDAVRWLVEHAKALAWDDTKELVASLAGAWFGAWFGARAARISARDDKTRDVLLSGIHSAHKVGTLAAGISNTAMSWKKQHMQAWVKTFKAETARAAAHRAAMMAGAPATVFDFNPDLNMLPPLDIPTEPLRNLVLDGSFAPRAISASLLLHQQTVAYERTNDQRNEIVRESKARGGIAAEAYFGFPIPAGLDRTYPDLVAGLEATLDDIIFYAWTLAQDAIELGEKRAKAHEEKFGKAGVPRISALKLPPEYQNLMPRTAVHAQFLEGFPPPIEPKSRLQRLRNVLNFKRS